MFEQPFVWGLPYATGTSVQWNMADKKMADLVMSMFGAGFARTANPSVNTIKWEPYDRLDPGILIVERNIDMSDQSAVDYRALAFWNDYYPLVLDAAINNCCNVTSLASPRTIEYHYRHGIIVIMTSCIICLMSFAHWSIADLGFV